MHMVMWLDKQLCCDGCPEFQLRLHHQKTFIIHEVTNPLTVRRSITQTSCIRWVGFTEITSATDRQTDGRTDIDGAASYSALACSSSCVKSRQWIHILYETQVDDWRVNWDK